MNKDHAVVLKVGDEYFAGLSGSELDSRGKPVIKLKPRLVDAKMLWARNDIRAYIRRLEARGHAAIAYQVCISGMVEI